MDNEKNRLRRDYEKAVKNICTKLATMAKIAADEGAYSRDEFYEMLNETFNTEAARIDSMNDMQFMLHVIADMAGSARGRELLDKMGDDLAD